ncbi:MAG: hypothetical protein Q8P30_00060 [Candidatus Uhrbacteria bacterium]|nr:hypothetical protein [Candidatus Uhrbacteria bacterium]
MINWEVQERIARKEMGRAAKARRSSFGLDGNLSEADSCVAELRVDSKGLICIGDEQGGLLDDVLRDSPENLGMTAETVLEYGLYGTPWLGTEDVEIDDLPWGNPSADLEEEDDEYDDYDSDEDGWERMPDAETESEVEVEAIERKLVAKITDDDVEAIEQKFDAEIEVEYFEMYQWGMRRENRGENRNSKSRGSKRVGGKTLMPTRYPVGATAGMDQGATMSRMGAPVHERRESVKKWRDGRRVIRQGEKLYWGTYTGTKKVCGVRGDHPTYSFFNDIWGTQYLMSFRQDNEFSQEDYTFWQGLTQNERRELLGLAVVRSYERTPSHEVERPVCWKHRSRGRKQWARHTNDYSGFGVGSQECRQRMFDELYGFVEVEMDQVSSWYHTRSPKAIAAK